MADDVTFQTITLATPPDATTVATDEVGGKHYQRVKLDGGGDGLSVPIIAGQKARASSVPVALATEDATLLANLLTSTAFSAAGLATAARQDTLIAQTDGIEGSLTSIDGKTPALGAAAAAASTPVTLATDGVFVNVVGASADAAVVSDVAGTVSGKLRGLVKWAFERMPASLGQKAMAASLPVVLASDQAAIPVKETRAATPTQSSVAGSASSASILTSNSNRLGATVYNDSTAILYLKLGGTASTSSYSVQMQANSYYEVPFNYTGAIDGIWSSATGNARITELVA